MEIAHNYRKGNPIGNDLANTKVVDMKKGIINLSHVRNSEFLHFFDEVDTFINLLNG